MKRNFLTLLFLFLSLVSLSQSVKVNYVFKKNISPEKLAELPEFAREEATAKYNYTLEYCNGISIFKNHYANQNVEKERKDITEETIEAGTINKKTVASRITNKSVELVYYKDLNSNLVYANFYANNINNFIKDNFINWNWEITKETKIISGFECTKAISNYLGYNFVAWFTEDIAVNAGPEKFDGLPGLILYAGTNHIEFVATNVVKTKENLSIEKPSIPEKTITFSEYDYFSKNEISKFKAKGNTTTTNGNTTTTTIRSSFN